MTATDMNDVSRMQERVDPTTPVSHEVVWPALSAPVSWPAMSAARPEDLGQWQGFGKKGFGGWNANCPCYTDSEWQLRGRDDLRDLESTPIPDLPDEITRPNRAILGREIASLVRTL